jgi:hypothetical protein
MMIVDSVRLSPWRGLLVAMLICVAPLACGDDEDGDGSNGDSPEETASSCESADQCFDGIEIEGDAICLDRVRGGHCTHTCASDEDCCAAEDECETDITQVCSPFESTGEMMCFLSCEREQTQDYEDENEYCQERVASDFICRSSGGGSNNRKICVPGDCGLGAACDEDADCDGDLECLGIFKGGYCTSRGCESNADCPGDALCVTRDDEGVCLKPCNADSDCTFCRFGERGECSEDVEFREDGTSGAVCVGD